MPYRSLLDILTLSALRGFVFPDFHYAFYSLAVIQVLYPILLLLPLVLFRDVNIGYGGYWIFGFIGMALSQLVAAVKYVSVYGEAGLNSVSITVFALSLAAMTILFSVLLAATIARLGINVNKPHPHPL